MVAKPQKTRQAEAEDRKRAAGLLRYSRWIHPADAPAMDAMRDKLARKREKEKP